MSDTHHDYDAGPHVRQRDYEPSRVEYALAHAASVAIDQPAPGVDLRWIAPTTTIRIEDTK
ncbi:hypothetical protein [Cumulibacter soli]|uniref:hypothetical protein n=1 Tax=Cumulibacter soli TaxID=2546344 RepID=UPI001067ECBD|nr:hypothetical protein [Cumulibacter soli]